MRPENDARRPPNRWATFSAAKDTAPLVIPASRAQLSRPFRKHSERKFIGIRRSAGWRRSKARCSIGIKAAKLSNADWSRTQ